MAHERKRISFVLFFISQFLLLFITHWLGFCKGILYNIKHACFAWWSLFFPHPTGSAFFHLYFQCTLSYFLLFHFVSLGLSVSSSINFLHTIKICLFAFHICASVFLSRNIFNCSKISFEHPTSFPAFFLSFFKRIFIFFPILNFYNFSIISSIFFLTTVLSFLYYISSYILVAYICLLVFIGFSFFSILFFTFLYIIFCCLSFRLYLEWKISIIRHLQKLSKFNLPHYLSIISRINYSSR